MKRIEDLLKEMLLNIYPNSEYIDYKTEYVYNNYVVKYMICGMYEETCITIEDIFLFIYNKISNETNI